MGTPLFVKQINLAREPCYHQFWRLQQASPLMLRVYYCDTRIPPLIVTVTPQYPFQPPVLILDWLHYQGKGKTVVFDSPCFQNQTTNTSLLSYLKPGVWSPALSLSALLLSLYVEFQELLQ